MWSACVGVCQLLNGKMHGETLKLDKISFKVIVLYQQLQYLYSILLTYSISEVLTSFGFIEHK